MKKPTHVKIIYEDNHLLVVEKPVNILTQGDRTGDGHLLGLLKDYVKERYNKPGEVYLGLVHRLDRPVGGVMVFARTSKAAARLSQELQQGRFMKTYYAVIHGVPMSQSATLEDYLLKDKRTNIVKKVSSHTPGNKKAVLAYRVLESQNDISLLEINLQTGRSHQIRVQMVEMGHPLFGDQKYGKGHNKEGQQLALWSAAIKFNHPTLKESMEFRSPPPQAFPWSSFNLG